jgi:hypothetical protein
LHNKPIGCGASGAYALVPVEEEEEKKATDTHLEYAKLIAFPLQQWVCRHEFYY